MARKFLISAVIVAVLAAALSGAQADTQDQSQDLINRILGFGEKFLKDVFDNIKNTLTKAQSFIDAIKKKIRDEEDKLLNQIPDPLGQLLKGIIKKIHDAEDKQALLSANMTACVINEAQPAFEIINATWDATRNCVKQSTSDVKQTVADFEGLLKKARDMIAGAPGDLISCIKMPPTSETWSCISGKVKDLTSKGMMLMSSIVGDMGEIGQKVPQVLGKVVKCGGEQQLEGEKKLGQIIEKIGACEKSVINNST